jgi:serine/threonine protein kinase
MAQAPRLQVARVEAREGVVLRLTGVIDDTFDTTQILRGLQGVLVIDMAGVSRITSYGVRKWTNVLAQIPIQYFFINCRPSIVSQFNIVFGFAGRGQLLSLFVPYVCNACTHGFEVLWNTVKRHEEIAAYQVPDEVCPACGGAGSFDDLAEQYFGYVAGCPVPSVSRAVETLLALAEGRAGGEEPRPVARVNKEIADGVTASWLSGPIDERARFSRVLDGLEGNVVIVAENVSAANPDSIAKVLSAARSQGVNLYLGRLSPSFVEALARRPELAAGTTILSVRVPFTCRACGLETTIVLDDRLRDVFGSMPKTGITCPSCGGGPTDLVAASDVRSALETLPFGEAPTAVRRYLEGHPSGTGAGVGTTDHPATPNRIGSYRLVRPLGAGGMAEVFLAVQTGPDGFERTVALKCIHPHLSRLELFVSMFVQEAQLAARLSHPNILPIHELGKAEDRYYYSMEYVRGWDLATVLETAGSQRKQMPIELACHIVADVLAALEAAHEHRHETGTPMPIVHRDVSPSNILISSTGLIKLTDFGIAKAADTVMHTESGVLKGKLPYMAPERFQEGQPVDARQDLFAAAVVLHECLTGKSLFRRTNDYKTIEALCDAPVPLVADERAGAHPELDRILARGLARAADARFATAREFRDALLEYLAQQGERTTPVGGPDLAAWLGELFVRGSTVRPQTSPADDADTDPVYRTPRTRVDEATTQVQPGSIKKS